MSKNLINNFVLLILLLSFGASAFAQTSAFVYQGKLTDGATAANGTYQFQFKLFDATSGGNQIGQMLDLPATVTNGIFAVNLDFGVASFDGAARFLEISVKSDNAQAHTTLNPRQPVTSSPYAIRALNANQANQSITANTASLADNAVNLGGIAANQYVLTTDPRLNQSPGGGSSSFIQNSTVQQANSNFNISGEGKANILGSAVQYNLGNERILTGSLSQGNLYFGAQAGEANPTAGGNTLIGVKSGKATTTGFQNSFFGQSAGLNNLDGHDNSMFGNFVGALNTSGSANAFFGAGTGFGNTLGNENSFFGMEAGANNKTGSANTFLGRFAGLSNTSENGNTFIGYKANGAAGITNATAIGANAIVTQSNSMVLGTNAVTVQIPGNLNIGGDLTGGNIVKNLNGLKGNVTLAAGSNITITPTGNTLTIASTGGGGSVNAILNQTTQQAAANFNIAGTGTANIVNALTQYNIGGARFAHTTGTDNTFVGALAGNSIAAGGNFNAFFGAESGKSNTSGFNNAFIGAYAGRGNTTGTNNAFFGANAGLSSNGNSNSFFGSNSGFSNTGGADNSFFGNSAGMNNSIGNFNSFFGRSAGASVTNAINNSFFGAYSGENTTTGGNAFFGAFAGQKNTTGFANSFFGLNSGKENTGGSNNTYFGANTGQVVGASGSNNTFIGSGAGQNFSFPNTNGSNNIAIGFNAKVSGGVSNAAAIGANASASQSNTLVLGTTGVKTIVEGDLEVKGITKFETTANLTSVNTNSLNVGDGILVVSPNNNVVVNDSMEINGAIFVTAQASFGATTVNTLGVKSLGVGTDALCYSDNNPQVPLNPKVLAKCSSSRRYKENIQDFKPGLNLIKNLRPVTFDWTTTKHRDIGFVAEEVAEAEPLLATRNSDGQIEGVKYAQITTALVNAVKEQQEQIQRQQLQIEALKSLVCTANPSVAICQPVQK